MHLKMTKKKPNCTLNNVFVRIDFLQSGNQIRSRFAGSILRTGQNIGISAADSLRNCLFLNGTRMLSNLLHETFIKHKHQHPENERQDVEKKANDTSYLPSHFKYTHE